ncbi:hypothetical protein D3C79_897150 [compost metagenome]
MVTLQHVESLVGISRTHHADGSHRHGLVPGSFQAVAQAAAVANRQGQARLQGQRRQALGGTPCAIFRVGSIIVDGFHQLAFRTGLGNGGDQGQ